MYCATQFFISLPRPIMKSNIKMLEAKPHYELLDGLRGVAALLVVIYHIFEGFAFAGSMNGVGSGLISTFNHGHIAVDFFFLLSGFVISYAYDDRWNRMTVGEFCKRRIIRLHPMLIMGAILGALSFIASGYMRWDGTTTPFAWVMVAMLCMIFMIPAVPGVKYDVRGYGEMFSLNGPAWSLFFEYVGSIIYALVLRRLTTKVIAVLAVVLGVLHAYFFVGDISQYNSVGVGWTIDVINFCGGLIRILFPFTIGMLLARTVKPRKVKGAFWISSLLLVISFAVPYLGDNKGISVNSLYEVLCIAILFPAIIWLSVGGRSGDNTKKISSFLGKISYPLYIGHYPIMYLFYMWLIRNKCYGLGDTLFAPMLVVILSVLLAYGLLKFYDEPVRKWLTNR